MLAVIEGLGTRLYPTKVWRQDTVYTSGDRSSSAKLKKLYTGKTTYNVTNLSALFLCHPLQVDSHMLS